MISFICFNLRITTKISVLDNIICKSVLNILISLLLLLINASPTTEKKEKNNDNVNTSAKALLLLFEGFIVISMDYNSLFILLNNIPTKKLLNRIFC